MCHITAGRDNYMFTFASKKSAMGSEHLGSSLTNGFIRIFVIYVRFCFWLSSLLFKQQSSEKSHLLQIILFIQYEGHILHQCSLHSRSSEQTCVTNNKMIRQNEI